MVYGILSVGILSFLVSWSATLVVRRVARRIGFVDKPGGRKIHSNPKPLGGGIGIFLGLVLPLGGALIYAWSAAPSHHPQWAAYVGGMQRQTPLAIGVLLAMTLMLLLGLWDDRKALGPYPKLIGQLAIAAMLVIGFKLRVLTALGTGPSIVLTILWITAITNAFNFLDNMDGLSAGVAAVCAAAFLLTTLLIGQWFVAATLAMLLGALAGFLCFNFPPASIFMGDAGSLVVGLTLGILTVRTTFLPPDKTWAAGWYSVLAPVIVMALPLYDLIVVSLLRLMRGKSPFVGDTNHFSHRLVNRGMSKRTAVLCLYLVSAATAIAAILLPHVQTTFGAMLIVVQTALVLGVVALLEQHPLPQSGKPEIRNQNDEQMTNAPMTNTLASHSPQ